MSKDLGDFQTPPDLVNAVLHCLTRTGQHWTRALEPTCGQGNFIRGLLELERPPREVWGIELQHTYVQQAQDTVQQACSSQVFIHRANIFQVNLRADAPWKTSGPLLVVGNPPWITNAALGSLASTNLPAKSNLKGLSGLEAMTGESNFDIAEYILLKLIRELEREQPTIAFLCKTSVARNILYYAFKANLPVGEASIRKIDSKKFFGAFVDGCLFCFKLGVDNPSYQAEVYDDLLATEPLSFTGVSDGRLVANVDVSKQWRFLDGTCPLSWRQGMKHDAASIMELVYDSSGRLMNKLGEIVEVEPQYVYPLLKSSDLGGREKARPKKAVIVTQQRIGEDTSKLAFAAPLLWKYLSRHQDVFDKRKSTIYKKQPSFAIFGVGPYTFAPYKVAISGMYKRLQFRALGPVDGKPVVFDDTCYFIPCASAQQAALVASLLQSCLCMDFLNSIIFWDAKRPVTKKLLQRIDLHALLQYEGRENVLLRANAELQRLGYTEQPIVWPDRLADFLEEYPAAGDGRQAPARRDYTGIDGQKVHPIAFSLPDAYT
jgi:hypothetical protein